MKKVNYKRLRGLQNLPRYDIGTNNIIPLNNVTIDATSGIRNVLLGDAPKITMDQNTIDSMNKAGQEAMANADAMRASTSVGSNVTPGGIYNAISGLSGLYGNITNGDTLNFGDLYNSSTQTTQYKNGVAYNTVTGYDVNAANKLVSALNKANIINGISNGVQAGSSIGSMFGPIGTGIGAGVGAITGFVGSLFGNSKRKREYEKAQENYRNTVNSSNMQNEAEASAQGVLNEYYATHADRGLSPNTKNPNALVQGGEPIVKVNKYGNVTGADMFAITPETPERVDNIPVRLDQGNTRHGVIGNKIDPFTGERLAVEGRPLVAALNDPNIKNKQPYKDGLKYLLDLQDAIPNNEQQMKRMTKLPKYGCGKKVKKCDCGKTLRKLDKGSSYAVIPATLNYLDNLADLTKLKGESINVRNDYTPNYNAQQALSFMPTSIDINPELDQINSATRQGLYAINQSNVAPGMRSAMITLLFSDRMKNSASVYSNKTNKENELRAAYANMLYTAGEADAQRRQASNVRYNENLAKATAAKRQLIDTRRADMQSNINKLYENLFSNYMFNKNVELYEKKLSKDEKATLALIERNAYNKAKKQSNYSFKPSDFASMVYSKFQPYLTLQY